MKKLMLLACLFATSAWAQQLPAPETHPQVSSTSPAMRQFKEQATCTMSKALDLLGGAPVTQSALLDAADKCVPSPFSPEMEGVPAHLPPSTRDERIASLSVAAAKRIRICEGLGITGMDRNTGCIKVFSKDGQP